MRGICALRNSGFATMLGSVSSRSRATSLPIAFVTRLAMAEDSTTARSRSSGSSISVCTGITVNPTWLPRSPPFSSPRKVIGTIATIVASGSSFFPAR
jgi:hypothetical protein